MRHFLCRFFSKFVSFEIILRYLCVGRTNIYIYNNFFCMFSLKRDVYIGLPLGLLPEHRFNF